MKSFIRLFVIGVAAFFISIALFPFSATTAVAQEKAESVAQEKKEISQKEKLQKEQGRKAHELGTMTVTAQKQEENVQEVSSSITVLDELDIEDRKIESVMEVVNFVPNMMIFNDGMLTMNRITTRGISAPVYANSTTSTGMYLDGVPTLGAFGYEEGIFDIERIEALRGPQGTLYGKNTETGAINIITRQPNNQFRGKVSAEGGNLLSSESGDKLTGGATLSLSGPILEDKLFFDLAGMYRHKDGFIENTYTGDPGYEQDRWSGRAKLRWTPMDTLDISLLVSYLSHEIDGSMNMNLAENGAAMFGFPLPSYRQVSSGLEERQEMNTDIESLNISYDINDTISLTSITARREASYDAVMDFDFSPMQMMHGFQESTHEKISQELRLDSSTDKFDWLVGLYYDTDDDATTTIIKSMIPSMNSLSDVQLSGDAYAIFGQLGYPLTERLKIIGGLRYETQDMELEGNIPAGRLSDSWQKVSPKISAEYNLTPDVMTYVTFSQGYRSGGFNHLATDPQYYSYDEETLWSYEIGMKSLFMDKRIMLNGSIFYMDITDMQVAEAVDPFRSWNTNAAEATSKGVELEITARVTDGLSLMGGFGYTDIEFDTFSDAKGNYEGNKNPFAPEYTFNIGAQYRHPSGFFARADLIGYGEMYLDKANKYSRDAYEIVNAKIGYETEHFDVYLYGKNLFDKEYDSDGYFGGFYTVYSDPGEIGLQAVYRF